MNPNTIPAEAIITGDDGIPVGHININQLQRDATLLMYAYAATAGDDDATDYVAAEWLERLGDPEYVGYVCASALSLMTRHVLGPVLDAAEQAGLDLRAGLLAARNAAFRDLDR